MTDLLAGVLSECAHAPYLRAVTRAFGARAGATSLEPPTPDASALLEISVECDGRWALFWGQDDGWWYDTVDPDGELSGRRRHLVADALVPAPDTVLRAAELLDERAGELPLRAAETAVGDDVRLAPPQARAVAHGDLTEPVARRLAVYAEGEEAGEVPVQPAP
ncbi:DUF6292 family protein [Streptomyces tubbatahanensis]|uniref:DUF6292 family protein n=1 Tax=Streptomyces tubbatahanensis TaxID=2923272 RepID=A0ABY3XLB3_9ACTN|nr:DUF6292 family protein [Streptomyces tubbatahanensis]UNS95195.1 DUF6292 family protein [Streptomyces tubbatahanensis]